MQITINTADDKRCTFAVITWFDLVAPPPQARRAPLMSAGSDWQFLQSLLPQPWRSPQKRCRYLDSFSRTVTGPWLPTGSLAVETFLNTFLSCWITDWKEQCCVWKSAGDILLEEIKNQTIWVEIRISFALFTWGCQVQDVKYKGWPEYSVWGTVWGDLKEFSVLTQTSWERGYFFFFYLLFSFFFVRFRDLLMGPL